MYHEDIQLFTFFGWILWGVCSFAQEEISPVLQHPGNWVLVIHGGAGGRHPGTMPSETENAYKEKLAEALDIGSAILQKGGSSMDAVEAVVRFMEDCPLFNAGKGAVVNDEGVVEMDASIMDGSTGMAGAVTGIKTIRHPVTAARRVMTETRYVLLMGTGAEAFALRQGLEMEEPEWFLTPERMEQFEKIKQEDTTIKGTVGAVALDNMGNLAAATSTGGLMMKMKGRVGGLIAVDREGTIAMPFNTNAMFRGYARAREGSVVEIY